MANDKEIKLDAFETLSKYRTAVNAAIGKGVREALLKHKHAGNSVAVSRNGEIVFLQPDEIEPTGTSLDVIWNNTADDVYSELLLKK